MCSLLVHVHMRLVGITYPDYVLTLCPFSSSRTPKNKYNIIFGHVINRTESGETLEMLQCLCSTLAGGS